MTAQDFPQKGEKKEDLSGDTSEANSPVYLLLTGFVHPNKVDNKDNDLF